MFQRIWEQPYQPNQGCPNQCQSCMNLNDQTQCSCQLIEGRGYCKCNTGFYYNKKKQQCLKCKSSCAKCLNGSGLCSECPSDLSYYRKNIQESQTCECKDGYQESLDSQKCFKCNSTCQTCNGPEVNNCTSCDQSLNRILIQNMCGCKDGFYEDQIDKQCKPCHNLCLTCSGSEMNQCLKCDENKQMSRSNPSIQSSSCICKNGYYFNSDNFRCEIFQCDNNCKQCDQINQMCNSCKDSYSYDKLLKSCILNSNINKEMTKSRPSVEGTTNYKIASTASLISVVSSFLSWNGNFIQQFLSLQKLNFLILIHIVYPDQVYSFIKGLSGVNPLDKLTNLNIISKYILVESNSELDNYKISYENYQTSVIYNIGGVIVCMISIYSLLLPVLLIKLQPILISDSNISKPAKITTKDNIISKYIFIAGKIIAQFNELFILITVYSMFLQIAYFLNSQSLVNLLGAKIGFLIATFIYSIFIFYLYYYILNSFYILHHQSKLNTVISFKLNFYSIIVSDFIELKTLSRNYKILQMIIESILIPFSVTMFYESYELQISFLMTIQFIFCCISITLRPSRSNWTNANLIIDQILWTILFICLFILGKYVDELKINSDLKSSITDKIDTLSFIIVFCILFILLLNPFITLLKCLSYIKVAYNYIINFIKTKLNKKQNDTSDKQLITQKENYDEKFYSIQINQTFYVNLNNLKQQFTTKQTISPKQSSKTVDQENMENKQNQTKNENDIPTKGDQQQNKKESYEIIIYDQL